jgi:hypothetical protein
MIRRIAIGVANTILLVSGIAIVPILYKHWRRTHCPQCKKRLIITSVKHTQEAAGDSTDASMECPSCNWNGTVHFPPCLCCGESTYS